jgi:hypothetical protein
MIENGVKTVLAAVAYANMDLSATTSIPKKFSDAKFPNKKVENGLNAAFHFARLQDKRHEDLMVACLSAIWQLHSRIYGILEAIVSIRAWFRHLEDVSRAPLDQQDGLKAEYEALTKQIGAGRIPPRALGPLVAFLIGGVKGLLVFPNSPSVYSSLKVSYLLVLINKIHQSRPIPEPIWKHTQSFILDFIEDCLFPNGIEEASSSMQDSINDDHWEPKASSKLLLTKAIQMDLANFCCSKPSVPDAFHLPMCTVNKDLVKGKIKGKGKGKEKETGPEQ